MLAVLTVFIAFFLAIAIAIAAVFQRIFNRTNLPGPVCLPVLGYIPALYTPLPKVLGDLAASYGDIFAVSLGSRRVVVLSSLETVAEAFKLEALQGRPQDYMPIKRLLDAGETGCTFVEGSKWRSGRKAIVGYLSKIPQTRIEDLAVMCSNECIGRIRELGSEPVETFDIFITFTGNFILHILGSEGPTEKYYKMPKRNQDQKAILRLVDFYPILRCFYQSQIRDAFREAADMVGLVRNVTLPNSERAGFENDFKMRGLSADIFDAGAFSSAETLVWSCLILAANPRAQELIFAELEDVLGKRNCQMSDLADLKLVKSAVLEILRISNVTGFGLPHKAISDVRISGFNIPKGTMVIANYAYFNGSDENDSRKTFDPKRFLDGKMSKNSLAFGLGKRRCPGEKLALQLLSFHLARLVQEFEIQLSTPDDKEELNRCSVSLTVTPGKHRIVFRERTV